AAPANRLQMKAPGMSAAGTAVAVTIEAFDPFDNPATGYTGTVHFRSTDKLASLPADYTFVAGDQGVHTFPKVILRTPGSQVLTATDTVQSLLDASATVLVTGSTGFSTATVVTSSLDPSVYGQTVTLTATVSPAPQGSGTPTGIVLFEDGGIP